MKNVKRIVVSLSLVIATGLLLSLTTRKDHVVTVKSEDPVAMKKRMTVLLGEMFAYNEDIASIDAIILKWQDLNETEYALYTEMKFDYAAELARKMGLNETYIRNEVAEARWVTGILDSLTREMYHATMNKLDRDQTEEVHKMFKIVAKPEMIAKKEVAIPCDYVNYPATTGPGANGQNTWYSWSRRSNEPGGETFCDYEFIFYNFNNLIQGYNAQSRITINWGWSPYVHWGSTPNGRTSVLCGYSAVKGGVVFPEHLNAKMQYN